MGIMLSPERLRRYPFFAGLSDSLIKAIAMDSMEVSIKKGEWLFHEGDEAYALYLILSGTIMLKVALREEGISYPSLSTLVEGDLLGWSTLVQPYTYRLSAVAASDSRLARIDGVRLCELMAHHPDFGYKMMSRIVEIIGNRLTDLRVRFVSLIEGGSWQSIEGCTKSGVSNKN